MILKKQKPRLKTGDNSPTANLIWLATNSCSAHIISFLNTSRPTMREVLQRDFNFLFDSFIMAAEGERATRAWYYPEVERGDFILVVEGTVPTAYGGKTTTLGKINGKEVPALQVVRRLGSLAQHVVAGGTCAAFGGPYTAWPNPTGSVAISKVLKRPVINVPGCPINPGWMHETLQRLRLGQTIRLDRMGRPLFLFGTTIHSLCERLPLYEASIFAQKPGDAGCMYLLGCKGPVTRADCPERRWIEQRSGWPVGVNSPCIGCTAPEFPDGMAPFFKHQTDLYTVPFRINLERAGFFTALLTTAAIGAHLAGQFITGRLNPAPASPALKQASARLKQTLRRLGRRER